MTITFIALLISNLTVGIWTTNKCNILYIPILYFVAVGIIELMKKHWIIGTIILSILTILFINFEIYYYTNYAYTCKTVYEEIELPSIIDMLEKDENTKELEKYIVKKYPQQQYIYALLQNKTTPYEFNKTKEYGNLTPTITRIVSYNNYNFPLNVQTIKKLDFENKEYIFVIEKRLEELTTWIQEKNYEKYEYEYYYILKPNK